MEPTAAPVVPLPPSGSRLSSPLALAAVAVVSVGPAGGVAGGVTGADAAGPASPPPGEAADVGCLEADTSGVVSEPARAALQRCGRLLCRTPAGEARSLVRLHVSGP